MMWRWVIFSVLILFFIRCNKNSIWEEDLKNRGFKIIDTLSIQAQQVGSWVFSGSKNYVALGFLNDTIRGKVKAGCAFQIIPSYLNLDLSGEAVVVDSIILTIQYNKVYGLGTSSFSVYTLGGSLSEDANIRSDYLPLLGKKIGHYEGWDPVQDFQKGSPLRVAISPIWLYDIVNTNNGKYQSESEFLLYFPGIALVPDTFSEGGAGAILNIYSALSNIIAYYVNSSTGEKKKVEFIFKKGGKFHTWVSSESSSTLLARILNKGDTFSDTLIISSMGVCGIGISFPYLSNFIRNLRDPLVLKAELKIPLYDYPYSIYPMFSRASVRLGENIENSYPSPDQQKSTNTYNGYFAFQDTSYTANITLLFQEMFKNPNYSENLNKIFIVSEDNNEDFGLAIISNNPNFPRRIKLIIYIGERERG